MEELTPIELEELAATLVRLSDEIAVAIEGAREDSKPVDLENPIGRLSRMDAMQQQQMEKAHFRRLELRLERVKIAQKNVERGEYGLCKICEDPIGYARLKLVPESPICVECQSEVEAR